MKREISTGKETADISKENKELKQSDLLELPNGVLNEQDVTQKNKEAKELLSKQIENNSDKEKDALRERFSIKEKELKAIADTKETSDGAEELVDYGEKGWCAAHVCGGGKSGSNCMGCIGTKTGYKV